MAYRERFARALKQEIYLKRNMTEGITTIYFGGGTPSVLSVDVLGDLLESIKTQFAVKNLIEVTLEVNPDDITSEYAYGLRAAGFNRVSMGVQSFVDNHLIWMNRRHKGQEAITAFKVLQECGFDNISLDLIFGYQALTDQEWLYNLSQITALAPQHISAYQMSVESGSKLSAMVRQGEYFLPSDIDCEAQYKLLQKHLQQNGYEQYEVSNFSRPGFCSKHNSAYWNRTPYLGLGPSAHSFDGRTRFWNTGSIKHYCDFYLSGLSQYDFNTAPTSAGGFEILSDINVFHEELMLRLRTSKGLNLSSLQPVLLADVMPQIQRQVFCGNLILEENMLRIPAEKFFISDSIIRETV